MCARHHTLQALLHDHGKERGAKAPVHDARVSLCMLLQLPGADRGQAHCTATGRANFTPDDFGAIFVASCAGEAR